MDGKRNETENKDVSIVALDFHTIFSFFSPPDCNMSKFVVCFNKYVLLPRHDVCCMMYTV